MSDLAAELWLGRRRGPAVVRAGMVVPADVAAEQVVSVMPGVVDHHVHLGLVDPAAFAGGAVVEVHDLGWVPEQAARWRAAPPDGVEVRIAGPFHTAPGGYPSGRSWAPDGAIRAVEDAADARAAVAEATAYGAAFIKITLHAEMALLGDDVLGALVAAAHDAGLPAVVHAEGAGQAVRAVGAGADVLVHTPWTELLDDDVLARATDLTWISTLAIHTGRARDTALENLCRFRALGGRVVYGTDLGNGPALPGVNEEEILALGDAGLAGDDLLAAVTGVDRPDGAQKSRLARPEVTSGALGPVAEGTGEASLPVGRALVAPLPLPDTAADLVAWLRAARRLDHLGGDR